MAHTHVFFVHSMKKTGTVHFFWLTSDHVNCLMPFWNLLHPCYCCRSCRSDTKVAFIPGGFMDAVAFEFGKEGFSAESADSAGSTTVGLLQ